MSFQATDGAPEARFVDRVRADVADRKVRDLVRKYFTSLAISRAIPLERQVDLERALRLEIAGALAEAGIPGQVARRAGQRRGWSDDFADEVAGRLDEALCKDVLYKLDLRRALDSSVSGWARQLLYQQATRTLARSECRARRAEPRADVTLELPKRPGVHSPATYNSVMQGSAAQAQVTTDDLDSAVDGAEDAEDFVAQARLACDQNTPHLDAWVLARYYGLPALRHLPPASFEPAASQSAPPGPGLLLAQGDVSSELDDLLTELSDVPPQVARALASSSMALHYAPRQDVEAAFVRLVTERTKSRRLARTVVRAWLGQWVDAGPDGAGKDAGVHAGEVGAWETVARLAVEAGALGTRNIARLEAGLEELFWSAHYQVGGEALAKTKARRTSRAA